MISLDISTIMLLHMTSLLTGAAAFVHLRRQLPRSNGLGWLARGYLVLAVGATLAGLGDQGRLPDWLWKGATLWLGTAGYGFIWLGLRTLSRNRRVRRGGFVVVVAFAWLALAVVTGAVDDNWQRAGIFHLNAIVFLVAAAVEVVASGRRERLPSRLPLAAVLLLCALAFAVGLGLIAVGAARIEIIAAGFFIQMFCYFWIAILVYGIVNERAERRLRLSAEIDPLTGLGNRLRLHSVLPDMVGAADAVIMLDIDHFKAVNDRFGHIAGDRTLAAVAREIQGKLREEDVCVRYGGEEFAIVLRNGPDGTLVAERLRAAIEALRIPGEAGVMAVTASLGVAVAARHGDRWEDLFEAADQALYRAKRQGRNRVVAHAAPIVATGP